MTDHPRITIGLRTDHRIVIRNDGDRFAVFVDPPLAGHDLDGTFAVWKAARGHASGVRMIHRFPIIDETCVEGLGA